MGRRTARQMSARESDHALYTEVRDTCAELLEGVDSCEKGQVLAKFRIGGQIARLKDSPNGERLVAQLVNDLNVGRTRVISQGTLFECEYVYRRFQTESRITGVLEAGPVTWNSLLEVKEDSVSRKQQEPPGWRVVINRTERQLEKLEELINDRNQRGVWSEDDVQDLADELAWLKTRAGELLKLLGERLAQGSLFGSEENLAG